MSMKIVYKNKIKKMARVPGLYEDLKESVQKRFKELRTDSDKQFVLFYCDHEFEKVIISDDEDLKCFIESSMGAKQVRVYVAEDEDDMEFIDLNMS